MQENLERLISCLDFKLLIKASRGGRIIEINFLALNWTLQSKKSVKSDFLKWDLQSRV